MVRQYPYKLWVEVVTPATQNENGDFVPNSSNWVRMGSCRDEPNSKGGVVNLEDGSIHTFDSIIYLPHTTTFYGTGVRVQVRDGESVRLDSIVVQFSMGQLNRRIWV